MRLIGYYLCSLPSQWYTGNISAMQLKLVVKRGAKFPGIIDFASPFRFFPPSAVQVNSV